MRHGLALPLAFMLGAAISIPQAALANGKAPQRVEAPVVAFEQLMERYYQFLSRSASMQLKRPSLRSATQLAIVSLVKPWHR